MRSSYLLLILLVVGRLSNHGVTSLNPPSKSSTKLQASALTTAASAVDALWRRHPYAAAGLTCGFKASMADLVAQKRQNKLEKGVSDNKKQKGGKALVTKPPFDVQRNVAFTIYGSVYQGMAQEFIYNHMYPIWFGAGTGVRTVLSKVLFDLLVQTTLVTLPVAYICKACIYRYSVKEAMRRYMDDIKNQGLLIKYFALWGPVQCCTFSVVPEHWRVTFIAFISFFWLIVLSTISSRIPSAKK
jgi:protein Mpv17